MTQLLGEAFELISDLPDERQDEIARRLLAELEAESDKRWEDTFARTAVALERMADEALARHQRGESEEKGWGEA